MLPNIQDDIKETRLRDSRREATAFLKRVCCQIGLTKTVEVEASGHDLLDLLYHLLDELLVCHGIQVL